MHKKKEPRYVDFKGNVKGLSGVKIALSIKDRAKAEEILKKQEKKFIGILENLKAGLAIGLIVMYVADKELGEEFKEIRDKGRDLINKAIKKIEEVK